MNVVQAIVAELARSRREISFRRYGDGIPGEGTAFLRVESGVRHVVLSWAPKQGIRVLSPLEAPDLQWKYSHEQADAVMDLLGVDYEPHEEREVPSKFQEEHLLLLPLARLVAGHVYAATEPSYDLHLPVRIADGLHDDFPEVRGALAGLVTAQAQGYWRMEQTSYERWDEASETYVRVEGPEPVELDPKAREKLLGTPA